MTPQEMHIGVDLILQKINSNFIDEFEPEQKDWMLNEEVLRFVKQRTSKPNRSVLEKTLGFQEVQKRFDDIKSLITPFTPTLYVRDSNSVFSYLPADYISLVNDRSLTTDLCGRTFTSLNSTTASNLFYSCLTINDDTVDLYNVFIVRINGNIVFDLNDYYPSGLPTTTSKFTIVNLLLQALNDLTGFSAKYENYIDIFCKSGILLVSETIYTVSIQYVSGTTNFTVTPKAYTKVNTIVGVNDIPNRLVDSEILYDLLANSIGTTVSASPISTLEKGKLVVFHKQKFILSGLSLDYIRKPRKIDLFLNQGCELDESTHEEIVENTAKRLAALTMNPNYKNIINENLLKE